MGPRTTKQANEGVGQPAIAARSCLLVALLLCAFCGSVALAQQPSADLSRSKIRPVDADGSTGTAEAKPAGSDAITGTAETPESAGATGTAETPESAGATGTAETPESAGATGTAETPESAAGQPGAADAAEADPESQDASQERLWMVAQPPVERTPLELLGDTVPAGSRAHLEVRISESFAGTLLSTPVVVVHGLAPGPRMCIVAGVHGDEVNGVEVVRRVLRALDPGTLRGTVIALPIANLSAFRRGSRYLPDRRDLNRYFPGQAFGSSASRIAHGLFENVLRHCEGIVDLHTGSFQRANIHQLRANLADPATAELSLAFGAEIVVNNIGRLGTLRRAATDLGIPAITVEAGESARFNADHVAEAVDGILRMFAAQDMLDLPGPMPTEASQNASTAYLRTRWVRCDHGGILVSRVQLGDEISAGQILGTIFDPLSDAVSAVTAPLSGRIIGMALDQVVMPGFAAFHVAYEAQPLAANLEAAAVTTEASGHRDLDELDLEERPE